MYLVLFGPVLEELAFRGLIQGLAMKWIRSAFWLVSGANVLTSLLFATAHAGHLGVLSIAMFPVSLILGWVRETTRRIWPCVILHSFYNTGLIITLRCLI